MEWLKGEVNQPYIPKSILELECPTPQYSDEYLTLAGPQSAPIFKQMQCWKCVPRDCEAAGKLVPWRLAPMECNITEELGYPGLSNSDHCRGWYNLLHPIRRDAYTRWSHSYAQREKMLPRDFAQHLREPATWYDPIVPAPQYRASSPRWGTFFWQDKHISHKEFVANRIGLEVMKPEDPNFVPFRPTRLPSVYKAQDFCFWSPCTKQYSVFSDMHTPKQ
ncbi:uncharacterized protein C19orf71 homolog [Tachyglossus aculeatus]|uniref:uncharacterized protein C19orf71 homolog n=1 Tax=Tachyglossus aculeatus TaxID=9261 RepID=UPI0018F3600E|nr:uncharacterized protein C19orf71 homolog [Tachyglossus aculeatus]